MNISNQELENILEKIQEKSDERMKTYLGVLNEMHAENLRGLRDGFDIINRKLDAHTKILDSHTEMIGELKEDVETIKDALTNKVDRSELATLR